MWIVEPQHHNHHHHHCYAKRPTATQSQRTPHHRQRQQCRSSPGRSSASSSRPVHRFSWNSRCTAPNITTDHPKSRGHRCACLRVTGPQSRALWRTTLRIVSFHGTTSRQQTSRIKRHKKTALIPPTALSDTRRATAHTTHPRQQQRRHRHTPDNRKEFPTPQLPQASAPNWKWVK